MSTLSGHLLLSPKKEVTILGCISPVDVVVEEPYVDVVVEEPQPVTVLIEEPVICRCPSSP